jgi:hypothetical protein
MHATVTSKIVEIDLPAFRSHTSRITPTGIKPFPQRATLEQSALVDPEKSKENFSSRKWIAVRMSVTPIRNRA